MGARSAPRDENKETTLNPQFGTMFSNAEYTYAPYVSKAVGAILYTKTATKHRAYVGVANGAYVSHNQDAHAEKENDARASL